VAVIVSVSLKKVTCVIGLSHRLYYSVCNPSLDIVFFAVAFLFSLCVHAVRLSLFY